MNGSLLTSDSWSHNVKKIKQTPNQHITDLNDNENNLFTLWNSIYLKHNIP